MQSLTQLPKPFGNVLKTFLSSFYSISMKYILKESSNAVLFMTSKQTTKAKYTKTLYITNKQFLEEKKLEFDIFP